MDNLESSKKKVMDALGELVSTAEAVASKNGDKVDASVFQSSKDVYDKLKQNQASGLLMNDFANLFSGLSEIFGKGVVSDAKSEQ